MLYHARSANFALGITALLVFDGLRFCQLLEGDRKPVLALTERIRCDARHTGVEVLHFGPLAERRFNDFQLAFTSGEEETSFAPFEALDGEAALAAFETMRATLPV